ncbi:MAG TPA: hypothetical protein VMA13_10010 [Candidatus Saccharimonadales bacterium]|nr:hypothetical protein [Candidatus Saccharimonadales bacterium]
MDISKNQASSALAADETELQIEKEAKTESAQNVAGQTPSKVTVLKSTSKMRVAMAH